MTWGQFCVDLKRYRGAESGIKTALQADPLARDRYLKETGQLNDHPLLVLAREQALATDGLYASFTDRMVFDYHIGNRAEFDRVLQLQIRARNAMMYQTATAERSVNPAAPAQKAAGGRPKRRAAQQAPAAWKGLSPQKRQRRA